MASERYGSSSSEVRHPKIATGSFIGFQYGEYMEHTVDGRNPAPVDRWFIPLSIGFQPSKVVQDFFHPQYHDL